MPPIGRFAPTPSGPLHFGSLVAAIASYCEVRSRGGRWQLRIEDVDTPRVVPGSAQQIIRALEQFGFDWDGNISYQSERFAAYADALSELQTAGLIYGCQCSRRKLRTQQVTAGPLGLIYPGNCRDKQLALATHAQRINTLAAGTLGFDDGYYGHLEMHLAKELGDPVLRRSDGIFAYHLAVVVDDENEGITQIVRGADLLHTTLIHQYLQQTLGYSIPDYYHVPLVNNAAGDKLSKQTGAAAIDPGRAGAQLIDALRHLGQNPDDSLQDLPPAEILKQAVHHWSSDAVRARVMADSAHQADA